MKKKATILFIFFMLVASTGCGKIESSLNTTSVEAGSDIDLTSLVSVGEGVSCIVMDTDFVPDKVGTYTVTYLLSDDKKDSEVTYKIDVVDTTAPTIELNGGIVFEQGETASLDGYITCTDIVDGDLTANVQYGNIDTSVSGEQTVTVYCSDSSGNQAEKDIVVAVKSDDPIYLAAQSAIDTITDTIVNPDKFVLKRIYGKPIDTNYVFYVVYDFLNYYDETVTDESYLKIDEAYEPVYYDEDLPYFFDSSSTWGSEYLQSENAPVKLKNEYFGYEADTANDMTQETDPVYIGAINAIENIKNMIGSPASFELTKALCRTDGENYYYYFEYQHENIYDEMIDETIYCKVGSNLITQNFEDAYYNDMFSYDPYFKGEFDAAFGETELDISGLSYL